jgi:hypothetical protein
VASATGISAGTYLRLGTGSSAERVKVTAVSSLTLTIVRGIDGTTASAWTFPTTVTKLSGTDPFLKYCLPTATIGQCTFSTVFPGTYALAELQTPDGYAKSSDMPKFITVALGDEDSDHVYTVTDPRKFKVITLVCVKSTDQLYGSSVTYDSGSAQTSLKHNATLPDGVSESELCGLGGATHDNVGTGSHSSSISIGVDEAS